MGVFQNPQQMRVEKYLAVIGNLDALQIWIEVQEPLKVLKFEEAAANWDELRRLWLGRKDSATGKTMMPPA